jgi:host factor-I protein
VRDQQLQNVFLDHVREERTPLTVFLINGVRLSGIITAHDPFCVFLTRLNDTQQVYKRAISTILPEHPITLPRVDVID